MRCLRSLAFAFALTVIGCAPGLINGVNNPITKEVLYTVENSAIVVFAGLNAYKKSCVQKVIPESCREVLKEVHKYTVAIPSVLLDLRKFVKENDQVNAIKAYNTVVTMVAHAKQVAVSRGVVVGE